MPDLSFVRAKIDRAYVHLKAADAISKTHIESDFYGLAVKPYRNGRYHLRVTEVTPFPPEFSILLGEVAYQLRSGMDHLAFAFSAPQNRREEKDVQFPFCNRQSEWKGTSKRQLPGVNRQAARIFERFQPYHRRKEPAIKSLWYVNVLSNWEKHRAPATAAAGLIKSKGGLTIPAEMRAKNFVFFANWMVKPNEIIARFDAEKRSPNAEVHIKAEHTFTPVFDERMTKISKVSVFHALGAASLYLLGTVLPTFERLP